MPWGYIAHDDASSIAIVSDKKFSAQYRIILPQVIFWQMMQLLPKKIGDFILRKYLLIRVTIQKRKKKNNLHYK